MKEFVLLGISHKTASVECRERLSVPEHALPAFLRRLSQGGVLSEAVVISTCNRMEVYAAASSPDARAFLEQELARLYGDTSVSSSFYFHRQEGALRHLFRVAAGLDSLVIGESEILGQVKRSYELALKEKCTGKLTNVVFQRALFIGKKVRTDTSLTEGPTSVAAAAVALAQRIFGDLKDNRVLIVGAGQMAELAARHIISQKVGGLCVVNRTFEKAEELARRFQGTAAPFERLLPELKTADVVICSTGSPEAILRHEDVADVMELRRGRPLFLIDIAVPRDVDPKVHTLEGVYLYNIDDLESIVKENTNRHRGEIQKAEFLVGQKTEEFSKWYRAWEQGENVSLRHGQRPFESALTSSSAFMDKLS
jgi:glutamyl-tRNA reductase